MPSLLFDKCCGFIELKTGCFILGYFNLAGTLIMTVFTIMAVAGGAVLMNVEDKEHQGFHEIGLVVLIVSIILLIFLLLALVFAIVLLVGLHKNKPGHLKAYLIYTVIFLVIYTIQFFASFAGHTTVGTIFQGICVIILQAYFLLVIRSMYYQMKDPSRGPAIYSAA